MSDLIAGLKELRSSPMFKAGGFYGPLLDRAIAALSTTSASHAGDAGMSGAEIAARKECETLEWRQDYLNVEQVRQLLQQFQFVERELDVPKSLISAARYAIQYLQNRVQLLRKQVEQSPAQAVAAPPVSEVPQDAELVALRNEYAEYVRINEIVLNNLQRDCDELRAEAERDRQQRAAPVSEAVSGAVSEDLQEWLNENETVDSDGSDNSLNSFAYVDSRLLRELFAGKRLIPADSEQVEGDAIESTEFEIWQADEMVASVSGPKIGAAREMLRYASQYEQDGPITVYEVTRREVGIDALSKQAGGV